MSSGRRGRGGGDRGGRGARAGGSNPFRGGSGTRGKANGFDTPTRPASMQKDSPRGGAALRGGPNARSGQDTRNNFRGQGINKASLTSSSVNATIEPNFKSSNPMNSTPFPDDDYQSRLEYLRNERPRQREQLIKKGLMDPDGQMRIQDRVEKYGLCTDMCSEFERVRRIVEMDFKAAECTPETARLRRNERVPDESRMVKAHTRSAAGTESELITEVRTPDTCLRTLKYMFQRLDTDGMDFLYQFIWDRSRSVRKDLSVGALKPGQGAIYLECVEMCVRFHLLSLHQMAKGTSPDYDHAVDHGNDIEQLQNCYTSLRHHYSDDLDRKVDPANRAEFIAYDIIMGLKFGDTMFEHNAAKLEKRYQGNKRIMTAFAIVRAGQAAKSTKLASFACKRQNWIEFWRLIKSPSVSYLMACAAELAFNGVRHHVLDTLRIAYRPRNNRQRAPDDWTLEKLMEPLGFDNPQQVKDFCEVYGFGFGINADGVEFLDLNSILNPGRLTVPSRLREQYYSETIVEAKRYGRTFSAVIQGMSVHEARVKGLVESAFNFGIEADTEAQEQQEQGNGGSLFVPDQSTPKPALSGLPLNGATDASQEQAGTPKLNPFASVFKPASNANPFQTDTSAKPNPFASTYQNGGATPATVQSGLFDASKHNIQFAPPSTLNGTPSLGVSSANPFKAASTTPATPNPFASAAASMSTPTPTSLFVPTPSTATPVNTIQQSTSQSPAPWSFSSMEKLNQNANSAMPISSGPSAPSPQPHPTFSFASQASPQPTTMAQEEERRKAQEQQRIADEQRRAQEEQERQARAAEQQRRLQVEQERQRLIREEEERKLRAEQERQAQIEQLHRARQEAEQRARQEHDRALSGLATNLLMDPNQGLMSQYLEHIISSMTKQTAAELEEQRLEVLAEEMYQQKRLAFTRAVCVKWVQQVERKKKKAETRRRRQGLRALRAEAESLEKSTLEVQAPVALHNATRLNGLPDGFKKPEAPASVQRRNGPSNPQKTAYPAQMIKSVSRKAKATEKKSTQRDVTAASHSTNGVGSGVTSCDYSENYYKSKAPSDRTETDWFKLRAMGIDPSKHRKRSFGSVSSDDDEVSVLEPKRACRSTSSSFRRSLPPPSTDEELLARFNAVRGANKGNATPRSFNGNRPVNGNTSAVIAQAREMLANTPTPRHSPPSVQHKYSRSVPGLEISKPSPGLSMFGRSIGAAPPNERPAFWGRSSRFVPQHLYGKGPEAIRAYRNQVYGRSSAYSAPFDVSSPIPTQQSYIPTGETQHEDEESLEHVVGDDADGEEEEEEEDESLINYDEEYDEEEQEQEDMFYEQSEEDYDEDGDSDTSDGPLEQFAQKAGGTQEDAIELSD